MLVDGSLVIVSEGRPVVTFHSFDLAAVAEVSITQSASQNVVIETDDNIIDHIFTRVSSGVLTIDSDVDYTTQHGVIVSLDMTEVQSLRLSGVGGLTGQNSFTSDDLVLTLSGVGSISVSGTAKTLVVTQAGTGSIDAENLQTGVCTVTLSGQGDCRVNVTQELTVTISGIGNVYYAGDPAIVNPPTITGLGSLIPL